MITDLKIHFSQENITYDGKQLSAHFAYRRFGICGHSCVGFIGPCHVNTSELVDLEDALAHDFIQAKSMLHFITEIFINDLNLMIAYQRLMVTCLADELHTLLTDKTIRRDGDDIFIDDRKFTVSIASLSAVSSLIHLGINIDPTGAPDHVTAIGTEELEISAPALATSVLNRFKHELSSLAKARAKVMSCGEYK